MNVRDTLYLGRPGPPALLLRDNELSWTVESVEPILEYDVHYRLAREDTWTGHKVLKSAKGLSQQSKYDLLCENLGDQHGDLWQKTVKLDFLKPDTEYEIQLTGIQF